MRTFELWWEDNNGVFGLLKGEAKIIWDAALAATSGNSNSTPCEHLDVRSGGLGKPDICCHCGKEL